MHTALVEDERRENTEQRAEIQSSAEPLALPAPSDAEDTQKLDLSQEQIGALKFDALGPLAVNSEGTLSRITNWDTMIPLERERTMRVLNAKNRLRLDDQQNKSADPSGEPVSLGAGTALP